MGLDGPGLVCPWAWMPLGLDGHVLGYPKECIAIERDRDKHKRSALQVK